VAQPNGIEDLPRRPSEPAQLTQTTVVTNTGSMVASASKVWRSSPCPFRFGYLNVAVIGAHLKPPAIPPRLALPTRRNAPSSRAINTTATVTLYREPVDAWLGFRLSLGS
jgi:hypothetical protein